MSTVRHEHILPNRDTGRLLDPTAAKFVWIVLAVMLVLALLNALSLALISPG